MFLLALIVASLCVNRAQQNSDLGGSQMGSPWDSGNNEYYYDSVHPDDALPTITSTAKHFEVNEGDNVVLPCEVYNLGEFSLIWRNEKEILWILQERAEGPLAQAVSLDTRLSFNGTSLSLKGAKRGDEGTYLCEVSTQPPRTLNHTLAIRFPPTVHPANNRSVISVKVGSPINLTCLASGNPKPNVTWSFTGGRLTAPASGNILTLKNTRPEDNGEYRCTADNGVGKSIAATITLKVMHSPIVRAEEEEVITGVSYDATLACFVDAEPKARVVWYRVGGIPVDPMRLVKTRDARNRHTLHFDVILMEDFGDYTCNATNYMGNSSAVVRLSGRPKPVRYFSPPHGDQNTTYTLIWDVESYAPVLTYNIAYRNETDSEEQWVNFTVPGTTSSSTLHSSSHVFENLLPGATYHVQVTATNEFGESDVNETFIFSTLRPADASSPRDGQTTRATPTTPLPSHQPQHVVSELGDELPTVAAAPVEVMGVGAEGVEQQETPAETSDQDRVDSILVSDEEVLSAASSASAVQDSAAPTLTPDQLRLQRGAFITAIILSCFFL